jgi:hypothetical protein
MGRYFGIRNASNASLVKVYPYGTRCILCEEKHCSRCGKARILTFCLQRLQKLTAASFALLHGGKLMVNITWLVGATQPADPGPVGDLVLMHSMDENFQIKSQNVVAYA